MSKYEYFRFVCTTYLSRSFTLGYAAIIAPIIALPVYLLSLSFLLTITITCNRSVMLHLYPLKIGANYITKQKSFVGLSGKIDVEPVRTMQMGLCYKLTISDRISTGFINPLILLISSYSLNLKKIQLLIASENTWYGNIERKWPYSNIPPVIRQSFLSGSFPYLTVQMEENHFIHQEGDTDFDKCLMYQTISNCLSIFDPRPVQDQ